MKKLLSFIRWKFVIPFAIVIAAIVLFFVLFFDPLLAAAIEKIGSRINGAKVDVTELKTKFAAGRLTIGRVQVTNRKEPMKNIFEAGPLAFQLSFSDLFSKRVIIPEATLKGLQFGTDRKVSGALPRLERKLAKEEKGQEPSAAQKLYEKYKGQFKLNLDGLKEQINAKIEFDPKKLKLVQQADALKSKADTLPDDWKKKVDGLNAESRLKKAEENLKTIKNTPTKGPEAISAIPQSLSLLKTTTADLNQLKQDVQTLKTEMTTEVRSVRLSVKSLPEAKQADINDILSRFNLDFADPQRLIEGLVGQTLLTRVQTILQYVETARKHLPSKKEKESLPARPRAKGMDIEFPTPAAPPKFWLQKAQLEGVVQDIVAAGTLSHVTSDPARVGKPLEARLAGKKGAQDFLAQAVLDHTTDISRDSFELRTSGLQLKQFASGGLLEKALQSGAGRARVAFNLVGDGKLDGVISVGITGLKFDDGVLLEEVGVKSGAQLSHEDSLKADFMRSVARSIERIPEVVIEASLIGTWQDPGFKINTNMVAQLAAAIKESVGNAVSGQRKQLEAEIDKVLKEKTNEVEAKLSTLEAEMNQKVGGVEQKVQQKINEATGIKLSPDGGPAIPGVKIPSLDKLFKK